MSDSSFGLYLRQERELRGVSLEEVAQKTKIPLRLLSHLEADEEERLPEPAVVEMQVKAYARVVGLDPHDAALRYRESRLARGLSMDGRPPLRPIRMGGWAGLALAAGALAVALYMYFG